MVPGQDRSAIRRWRKRISWRMDRLLRHVLSGVVRWLFFRYLYDEGGLNNTVYGLREACWTFLCGHGIWYSIEIGNIVWKSRLLPSVDSMKLQAVITDIERPKPSYSQ